MNGGTVTVGSFAPGGNAAYLTSFMPASALPSPTPIRDATVASSPASWITPPQSVAQAGLTPENNHQQQHHLSPGAASYGSHSPVPGMNVYQHNPAAVANAAAMLYYSNNHQHAAAAAMAAASSNTTAAATTTSRTKREPSYNYHHRIGSTGSPLPSQHQGLPDMFRVQATETSLRVSTYRPRSKSVIESKPHVLDEIRKALSPHALKFVVLESTQRGQWLPGFPEVLGPDNAKLRYRFVFFLQSPPSLSLLLLLTILSLPQIRLPCASCSLRRLECRL